MPYLIQRGIALAAIVLLSPLVVAVAAAVRLTSGRPVLHRAPRIGRTGVPFTLLKFRSMTTDQHGSALTVADDARVTPVGRRLRATKLDELPQLWNVVRGEMAIVGPRPEDPRYVDLADGLQRTVLTIPPGITGPAALAFADEERLLAAAAYQLARAAGRATTDADIDVAYRSLIQPDKLRIDATYVTTRTIRGDIQIIARTLRLLLGRAART